MHLFKKNTFVHESIIKYSCFMKMKNINCIRSQYINTFKWRLVAEFAVCYCETQIYCEICFENELNLKM